MLTEGFLAVLVILACVAGLGLGIQDTARRLECCGEKPPTFPAMNHGIAQKGLAAKIGAFVEGSGQLPQGPGTRTGICNRT